MDEGTPSTTQLAFMPWLRLALRQTVGSVSFVPLVDGEGKESSELLGVLAPIRTILSGYVDRAGKPINNCVVVVTDDVGWNLQDSDFERVHRATAILFLSCWAANEYLPMFLGPYVNASPFRVVWQRFSGAPVWVTLVSRRRDGRTLEGGYKHGEIKFSIPLQCNLREPAAADQELLRALGAAGESPALAKLRSALSFVSLANTDDDLMSTEAEAILMGSAFEQLLDADASAFRLGERFSDLFGRFGSVTVEAARVARPDIQVDTSKPERGAAQPTWWVHRKWIEELYRLRNSSAHDGSHVGRVWGWSPPEHLLMAAFVFPLAVKLLLEREGNYKLTDEDMGRCLAVDKLLAITGWDEEPADGPHRWHEIVASSQRDHILEKIAKQYLKEQPGVLSKG
jgi:hypothetical protein